MIYRDNYVDIFKNMSTNICAYARGYRRTYVLIYVHINVPIMLYVPINSHKNMGTYICRHIVWTFMSTYVSWLFPQCKHLRNRLKNKKVPFW